MLKGIFYYNDITITLAIAIIGIATQIMTFFTLTFLIRKLNFSKVLYSFMFTDLLWNSYMSPLSVQ